MALPQIRFGQIVWADIADANGVRKTRPAIVLTTGERIAPSAPLKVVAITSTLPQPLTDEYVLLPWHAQGHPRTGLKRKCAAVCNWLSEILPSEIHNVVGEVPGSILDVIIDRIESAFPNPPD